MNRFMTITDLVEDGKLVKIYKHLGTEWRRIPTDAYGLPDVEWLRAQGARIESSETKVENHRSLCGKYKYQQGYRIDTYPMNVDPPFFAESGETRMCRGVTRVFWPIEARLTGINHQQRETSR